MRVGGRAVVAGVSALLLCAVAALSAGRAGTAVALVVGGGGGGAGGLSTRGYSNSHSGYTSDTAETRESGTEGAWDFAARLARLRKEQRRRDLASAGGVRQQRLRAALTQQLYIVPEANVLTGTGQRPTGAQPQQPGKGQAGGSGGSGGGGAAAGGGRGSSAAAAARTQALYGHKWNGGQEYWRETPLSMGYRHRRHAPASIDRMNDFTIDQPESYKMERRDGVLVDSWGPVEAVASSRPEVATGHEFSVQRVNGTYDEHATAANVAARHAHDTHAYKYEPRESARAADLGRYHSPPMDVSPRGKWVKPASRGEEPCAHGVLYPPGHRCEHAAVPPPTEEDSARMGGEESPCERNRPCHGAYNASGADWDHPGEVYHPHERIGGDQFVGEHIGTSGFVPFASSDGLQGARGDDSYIVSHGGGVDSGMYGAGPELGSSERVDAEQAPTHTAHHRPYGKHLPYRRDPATEAPVGGIEW